MSIYEQAVRLIGLRAMVTMTDGTAVIGTIDAITAAELDVGRATGERTLSLSEVSEIVPADDPDPLPR